MDCNHTSKIQPLHQSLGLCILIINNHHQSQPNWQWPFLLMEGPNTYLFLATIPIGERHFLFLFLITKTFFFFFLFKLSIGKSIFFQIFIIFWIYKFSFFLFFFFLWGPFHLLCNMCKNQPCACTLLAHFLI